MTRCTETRRPDGPLALIRALDHHDKPDRNPPVQCRLEAGHAGPHVASFYPFPGFAKESIRWTTTPALDRDALMAGAHEALALLPPASLAAVRSSAETLAESAGLATPDEARRFAEGMFVAAQFATLRKDALSIRLIGAALLDLAGGR